LDFDIQSPLNVVVMWRGIRRVVFDYSVRA
jgi:hypothetical protein